MVLAMGALGHVATTQTPFRIRSTSSLGASTSLRSRVVRPEALNQLASQRLSACCASGRPQHLGALTSKSSGCRASMALRTATCARPSALLRRSESTWSAWRQRFTSVMARRAVERPEMLGACGSRCSAHSHWPQPSHTPWPLCPWLCQGSAKAPWPPRGRSHPPRRPAAAARRPRRHRARRPPAPP